MAKKNTGEERTLVLKEAQVKTLVLANMTPPAVVRYMPDDSGGAFQVFFKVTGGAIAQLVNVNNSPRSYKDFNFFLYWAKKVGLKEIQVEPISVKTIILPAVKTVKSAEVEAPAEPPKPRTTKATGAAKTRGNK